jgi:hypothetical protein
MADARALKLETSSDHCGVPSHVKLTHVTIEDRPAFTQAMTNYERGLTIPRA